MFDGASRFVRLSIEHEIKPFDCGDSDLNEFLLVDAKRYLAELLAVTYLIENETDTIAFFSVQNDKIAFEDLQKGKVEVPKQLWKKFRGRFVNEKRLRSYPSVKIGRLGVQESYSGQHYGSGLIDYIKGFFVDGNKTGCRFITVDSYDTAFDFYRKNGFDFLTKADEGEKTRLMYFDLMEYINP